jgi:hypothetical protein
MRRNNVVIRIHKIVVIPNYCTTKLPLMIMLRNLISQSTPTLLIDDFHIPLSCESQFLSMSKAT